MTEVHSKAEGLSKSQPRFEILTERLWLWQCCRPVCWSPRTKLRGWSGREAVLPSRLCWQLRPLQPDPGKRWPSHKVTAFGSRHEGYGFGSPARHPQQQASCVNPQAWKQQEIQSLLRSLSSAAPPPSTVSRCLGWTNCPEYLVSLLLAVHPCWQFLFELIND